MSQTRIYLPLTAAGLRALAKSRETGPAPASAYAVTARLERANSADLAEEELEHAAFSEAAEAALALQGNEVGKRVIAAADVDPGTVEPDGSREDASAVTVSEPVPLRRIVSFHVDESAGDTGLDDLLWYDATELDEVLRLL
jgi:hypothetical protein